MSCLAPLPACRLRSLANLAALGALTVVMLASPRGASAAQLYGTTTVYYQSSDLASDHEAHALYHRIAKAAAMVCPPEDSQRPDETAVSKECQRQAMAHAVAQIGSARLTAMFAHELARYRQSGLSAPPSSVGDWLYGVTR